ncbi:MAG TPA: hypothetical protein VIL92_08330 [Gaiellaceae bacterium]
MTKTLVAVAALIGCVAAVVAVGRWEMHRFESSEGARMRVVWREVSGSRPAAYRFAAPVDCLDYARGKDPFALEVCFDSVGRLVDVIDRRDATNSKRWSLRFDVGAAPLTVAPSRLIKIFESLGALRGYAGAGYLPMPQPDLGPTLAHGRT